MHAFTVASTSSHREVIVDNVRTYVGQTCLDIRKQTRSRRNRLCFWVRNTCKHYFGKGFWIEFQKGLLFIINPKSEKIYRNLYRKICDVFFEIPSQIVQITSHFAMRSREIIHWPYDTYTMQMNLPMAMVPVNGAIARVSQVHVSTGNILWWL